MSNEQSKDKFIVVVGASAGGLNALAELVSQLKPGIGAAYFIVTKAGRCAGIYTMGGA